MANIIERARQLPPALKSVFFGDGPMLAGEEAALLYGLPEEKFSSVTLPLGAIFVGDMKLGDYPSDIAAKAGVDEGTACGIAFEVNKRTFLKFPEYFKDAPALQHDWEKKKKPPVMSEAEAKKKVFELEPWLLEKDEEEVAQKKETAASYEKLPLLAALAKYAKLSEQQLSREKIRIKSQSEPVRPSLVNWLRSYRDELGVGYHDPVLRAKFLFNSPNCKPLSSEERERLNLVLRSVEDNVPLDIDVRKMEIVFPSFSVTDGQSAVPNAPAAQMPASEKKAPVEGKPKSLLEALQSTSVAAPGAKSFTPPQAPKRAVPPVPSPVAPQTAAAPRMAEPESGFRIGKGMHFTSLEQKPVPEKKPVMGQEEQFSFSSNHTLQAEQGDSSKFAIKQSSGSAIASGESFLDKSQGSAPAGPSPAHKMNPFQIRPVSLHGKNGDEDMGRIVDLKND